LPLVNAEASGYNQQALHTAHSSLDQSLIGTAAFDNSEQKVANAI
jgi:hypothetical protein